MPIDAKASLPTPLGERTIYRLDRVLDDAHARSLPYSIRVLLEACVRHCDGFVVTEDHVAALAGYDARNVGETEIAFKPGRVVLQDFTGVPAVVDLAAMRSGIVRMTGDEASAGKVNPLVPCDLVIDHSVQVDAFNSGMALQINSREGVRAQPRALRVPEVGAAGVRQLPRRAPGDRHRAPGQPGVPRQGRLGRAKSTATCSTPIRSSGPTATRR